MATPTLRVRLTSGSPATLHQNALFNGHSPDKGLARQPGTLASSMQVGRAAPAPARPPPPAPASLPACACWAASRAPRRALPALRCAAPLHGHGGSHALRPGPPPQVNLLYDGSDSHSSGSGSGSGSPLAAATARSLSRSMASVLSSGASAAPALADDASDDGCMPPQEGVAAAVRRTSQPTTLGDSGEASSAGSEGAWAPHQLGQLQRQVGELQEELAGRARELERAQQALPVMLLPALARLRQQLAALLEGPQLQGAGARAQLLAVADAERCLQEVSEQLQAAELSCLPLQEAQQPLPPFLYTPLRSSAESPGAGSALAADSDARGAASPADTAASSERMPLMGARRAGSLAPGPAEPARRRLPAASCSSGALLMQDNALFDEAEREAESGAPPGAGGAPPEQQQQQQQQGSAARQLSSTDEVLQQELQSCSSDVGLLQQELEQLRRELGAGRAEEEVRLAGQQQASSSQLAQLREQLGSRQARVEGLEAQLQVRGSP
jgi:hypothetical protein